MKKIIFLFLLSTMFTLSGSAQEPKRHETPRDSLPYILYPEMPAFNLRLLDSFTIFNTFNIPKGRPSVLVFFDPDCKHCQEMTKRLLRGMDSLQNMDFYWMTPNPSMTMLRKFYSEYHLADYSNTKVTGRDYEFFFSDYYKVNYVPDVAVYDENKKFLKLYESNAKVKDLYELTHK